MSEGSPEICIQKHTAKERKYTLPQKFTYENIYYTGMGVKLHK